MSAWRWSPSGASTAWGWRFALADGAPTAFELALEATRREHVTAAPPEHGAGLRMTARW